MNALASADCGSAPPADDAAQNLREVRRGVAQAADVQVLQVVRMVDALEDRGATDAVLEPVRSRLRAIQPARPLRFARLLFLPFDPLIVAPKSWRPGTPFLPRTALMVLSRAVRLAIVAGGAAQAGCLDRIDALIGGKTTAQTATVRQAGGLLWPLAAIALRQLAAEPATGPHRACVAEWSAEGLAGGELQPVALALASMMGHAAALHAHDHAGATLTNDVLLGMLAATKPDGPRAWGMMLSLLVIRVPQAATALLASAEVSRNLRPLADAATETALAWVETETADQTAGIADSAPVELARQAALLDALAAQPGDAARRRRLVEVKTNLIGGCLHRFEASLQDQVAAPLQALPADPAARDAALDAMEASARTLRRFELEARRIGGAGKFDAMVQNAGVSVAGAAGLTAMDRARLMEIIAGPQAAARLL